MNRRDFAGLLAGLSAIASLAAKAQNAQPAGTATSVTCLIHPNMVMMDLVAPLTVLNLLLADIRLVAKSSDPVSTELGLPVVPTHTFATAPRQSTVLFVPGGLAGSVATMQDQSTLNYLAEAGAQSDWVTSVCTGSLLLAAAGLLDGYRATSHWYVKDLLAMAGAEVTDGRVVHDRNRLTGGGVTAGLDFGLSLAAQLADENMAKTIQLVLEYDPAPPFNAGTPETAGEELTSRVLERRNPLIEQARTALSGRQI